MALSLENEEQGSDGVESAARSPSAICDQERLHSAGWRLMTERPEPLRRIIMLYDDGSGSRIYFHAEDGVLYDGEDGCQYTWEDRDNCSFWTYLPRGYRLWVEDSSTDPMTFPEDPAEGSTHAV